jgi:hypothetical protein
MQLAECLQKNIAATDSAASQSTVEASINILKRQLKHEWDREKLPWGLEERLSKARTYESNHTERILLDHGGDEAWVAYFRATHGKVHFKGQLSQYTTIAAFQQLSAGDRKCIARRLKGTRPHSTIARIIEQTSMPRKHRRK